MIEEQPIPIVEPTIDNESPSKLPTRSTGETSNGKEERYMTTEGFADDGTMLKDLAQFDLAEEMKNSDQKRPWTMGHFARTLFKKLDFRMVLISMDKGSILKEHHADGTISVQVLKGSIRFTAHGEAHSLQLNAILMLGASIKHEVEALEDSAFLLTVAWPSGEKLQAMKHRGYGT
jgi:quercetin dioxygenase-like cupin family protein